MATEETKPNTKETKPEENQSPEIKEPPPLPYNTCSFKVSIHCEGCKKKVKKILTTIEGVYKVDIDVKQHKVTVVGIVSPDILLKKLLKAGKQAVLIPEIPVLEKKKTTGNKNKKKEEKQETINGATSSSSSEQPESVKADAGKSDSGDGGDEVIKTTASSESIESSEPVKEEKKVDLKEKDAAPAESPSPSPEKSAGVEKKAEEISGNIVKKTKKKGQKSSNANGAPARPRSPPQSTFPTVNHDRPLHHNDWQHPTVNNHIPSGHAMYPYPASYYAPPIMYGVSYNVAQPPVSLHGPSYYTPPPPHSYAHMHPGGYLPLDRNPYPSGPSDSYELFSDENPNACSVM